MINNFSCKISCINNEILTCFIEFVNKKNVYSFTFDSNDNNRINRYSNKSISNSGGKIIKTISNIKDDF